MRVVLFGATGMVGAAVLRECLASPDVEHVLSVGRSTTGRSDPKLEELQVADVTQLEPYLARFAGYDAAFFCLGVSSVGMEEARYRSLTYDLTLAVARVLVRAAPGMAFVYVSGAGTDSTETGRVMWARVKGATENALLRLGFPQVYLFRPGGIQPRYGVRPRDRRLRVVLTLIGWTLPLLKRLAPGAVTSSDRVGRAMIRVARDRPVGAIVSTRRINELGRAEPRGAPAPP